MPCTEPKTAYPCGTTENGKQNYIFHRPKNFKGETIEVACGRCVSCQLDKSKEWATRCVHEAQMNEENCFITLTYADEHLPENGTLVKEHYRLFIRRLRRRFKGKKIKYLVAGEYGSEENTHRPHWHFCIFGIDMPDKKYLFTNKHGDPVYTSEILLELWQHKGHVTVAAFTYRTGAYTARYTLKKIIEKGQKPQWTHIIDKETGETSYDPVRYKKALAMQGKIPEFIMMSKGIGEKWLEKYHTDTDKDYVTVNYVKHKVPRYYDKKREERDPESLERIKIKRKEKAKEIKEKTDASELISRDTIKKRQIKQLKRTL
jgi:hypothetical protein